MKKQKEVMENDCRVLWEPKALVIAILLAFQSFFPFSPLMSQKAITVRYEQDSKGDYVFYCDNHAHCNYILVLGFTGLDNMKSDKSLPFRKEVAPGTSQLLRLSPENRNNPVKFSYNAGYLKGCEKPNPSPSFTYLLPLAPGKETQAYEMQNLQKSKPGEPEIRDWYLVRFKMNPGDTIYAARRGIVNELDVSSGLNDSGSTNIGGGNFIEIYHGDCSFGRYGIIRKNGALVKPGQQVEAGTPIGLVGGDRYGRGSEIRFSVSYNEEVFDGQGTEKQYQVFIPLQFWIKYKGKEKLKHGATYVCEHPAAVMVQEKPKPAATKKQKAKPK